MWGEPDLGQLKAYMRSVYEAYRSQSSLLYEEITVCDKTTINKFSLQEISKQLQLIIGA
jgi:hypothetical protein